MYNLDFFNLVSVNKSEVCLSSSSITTPSRKTLFTTVGNTPDSSRKDGRTENKNQSPQQRFTRFNYLSRRMLFLKYHILWPLLTVLLLCRTYEIPKGLIMFTGPLGSELDCRSSGSEFDPGTNPILSCSCLLKCFQITLKLDGRRQSNTRVSYLLKYAI